MNQREQVLVEQRTRIMENANRKIFVKFQKEGIHMYPGADKDPNLATGGWDDVSFLGVPHRHIFHFCVWIDVFHNDRDIEFIQFKRWLERLYSAADNSTPTLQLDHKSCEMIADDIYIQIAQRYPDRAVWIEVSEDNENGCLIKYELSSPNLTLKI
jgi:hypothetical protein|tara:strand:+ start:578 stop:1045 length:468 start_codon:yes stop_codon:yes gene_type:complete